MMSTAVNFFKKIHSNSGHILNSRTSKFFPLLQKILPIFSRIIPMNSTSMVFSTVGVSQFFSIPPEGKQYTFITLPYLVKAHIRPNTVINEFTFICFISNTRHSCTTLLRNHILRKKSCVCFIFLLRRLLALTIQTSTRDVLCFFSEGKVLPTIY